MYMYDIPLRESHQLMMLCNKAYWGGKCNNFCQGCIIVFEHHYYIKAMEPI